jgi:hypothetical protein
MRFWTSVVLICMAPLLMALASSSGQEGTAAADDARYDATSAIDVILVIADIRQVPAGSPLPGAHLLMRPESAKANSETTDVYLAPDDYLKDFNCQFAKGDRLQVKGSKIKFRGASVVLAREVRRGSTTIYLRDDQGSPYWKKS